MTEEDQNENVVPVESLTPWSKSVLDVPLITEAGDIPEEVSEERNEPIFSCSPEINSKISLWHGPLWKLELHAITNPTNEAMTDRSGVGADVFDHAGPQLDNECQTLDGCRTGESRVTSAYHLPARNVIHTVGPRFNEKYKTAAENALHSCYRSALQICAENELRTVAFPPISTGRKGYPVDEAAHIACRTIRRFLEKHGEMFDLIVIVCADDEEEEVQRRVLPLYFPRTEEEETVTRLLLPEDVGNDVGETVKEERKIRIVAFPSTEGGRKHQTPPHPVPAEETTPSTAYNRHFGSMHGDVDAQKKRSRPSEERRGVESERLYLSYLSRARKERLDDIEKLKFCYQCGSDAVGRPIVVVIAKNLPANTVEMDRILLYIVSTLDRVVGQDYVIVLFQSASSGVNRPSFSWMKQAYRVLNRKYKKNLKALYIVHPTFWTKVFFGFCRPFISSKFWKKLHYVPYVQDLFMLLERDQIVIPDFVFNFDAEKHGERKGSSSTGRSDQL